MSQLSCYLGIAISLIILNPASVLNAELVAYESFDYAQGQNLLGQSGGFGFTGAWYGSSSSTNYSIGSATLGYSGLPTSGRRVNGQAAATNAWMRRDLPASRDNPIGKNGTTTYFSMLLRPTGTSLSGQGYSVLSLVQPGQFGTVPQELTIGMNGAGTYGIGQLGGVNRVASNILPTLNQTALLVVKAEFNPLGQQNDTFTLFVNPILGAGEPVGGVQKTDFNIGTFSQIAIRSTGKFEIDEIRVGSTFDSVTSIPEPSFTPFVVVMIGLGFRRKKQTA